VIAPLKDEGRGPEVLLIGGPSGVGKTTVAAEMHAQLSRASVEHALIEGDSLDLAWPAPHERGLRLAEENLAVIWRSYRLAGYSRLIYTNTASVMPDVVDGLIEAVGEDPKVHGALLLASRSAIRTRLSIRERGSALQAHLDRSEIAAKALLHTAPPWVMKWNTSNLNVEEIAQRILRHVGWLGCEA
jgi:DNA polymerase III delta prime subunit